MRHDQHHHCCHDRHHHHHHRQHQYHHPDYHLRPLLQCVLGHPLGEESQQQSRIRGQQRRSSHPDCSLCVRTECSLIASSHSLPRPHSSSTRPPSPYETSQPRPSLSTSLSLSLFLFPLPLPPSMTARPPGATLVRPSSPFALTDHGFSPLTIKTLPTTSTTVTAAWHLSVPPRSTSLGLKTTFRRRRHTLCSPEMPMGKISHSRRRKHSMGVAVPSWPLARDAHDPQATVSVSVLHTGQRPLAQTSGLTDGAFANGTHDAAKTNGAAPVGDMASRSPTAAGTQTRSPAPEVATASSVSASVFFVVSRTMQGRGLPNLKLVVADGRSVYCWREIIENACPAFIDEVSDDGDLFLDSLEGSVMAQSSNHKAKYSTPFSSLPIHTMNPHDSPRGNSLNIPRETSGKTPTERNGLPNGIAGHANRTHARQLSFPLRVRTLSNSSITAMPHVATAKDKIKSVWDGLSSKPVFTARPLQHGTFDRRDYAWPTSAKLKSLRLGKSAGRATSKPSSIIITEEKSFDDPFAATSEVVHGELIRVSGCSLATLQTLIFYLTTKHIEFLPQLRHDRRQKGHVTPTTATGNVNGESVPSRAPLLEGVPAMPATAAYSLASQLGLIELQTRSLDHITASLKPDTVLEELLSPFGERFPNVRTAMLKYVGANWDAVRKAPTTAKVLERLAKGDFPAASSQLLQLWNLFDVSK